VERFDPAGDNHDAVERFDPAGDNHDAVERFDPAGDNHDALERFDDSAGWEHFLPGGDHDPPGPQRAVESAAAPAVHSAAR
jgi:hypothetical protein